MKESYLLMFCKICNSKSQYIFNSIILDKYEASYYSCKNCGFLQTEEPFWLEEAYNSPITIADTGIMGRNYYLSKITSVIIYFLFNKNARFLDYGGGYGIFTKLMRDVGFDFYWADLYANNLVAKGFEYQNNYNIELLTSFETFEHFVNPIEEIDKILNISKNILFTTELLPDSIPQPDDWWYYTPEFGQHISFYSIETLKFVAEKYELKLYSFKNFHLITYIDINPLYFNFLIKFTNYGLFEYVKKRLKSKTNEDMNLALSTMSEF